jgi:hypothetical protein
VSVQGVTSVIESYEADETSTRVYVHRFISPSSACSLFEIALKLFNKAELGCSKVVVLDEAHKVSPSPLTIPFGTDDLTPPWVWACFYQYLSAEGTAASEGSKRLTERLLTFTRQQRHLAMRVIIST